MDSADFGDDGKVTPSRFCRACLELPALPVPEVVRLFDAEAMPPQQDIARAAEAMIKETPCIPENTDAVFRMMEVLHWAKTRLHDQHLEERIKPPPDGPNKIAG